MYTCLTFVRPPGSRIGMKNYAVYTDYSYGREKRLVIEFDTRIYKFGRNIVLSLAICQIWIAFNLCWQCCSKTTSHKPISFFEIGYGTPARAKAS